MEPCGVPDLQFRKADVRNNHFETLFLGLQIWCKPTERLLGKVLLFWVYSEVNNDSQCHTQKKYCSFFFTIIYIYRIL